MRLPENLGPLSHINVHAPLVNLKKMDLLGGLLRAQTCAPSDSLRLSFLFEAVSINRMNLLVTLVRTVIGWLLEIPPDLLGRRIENVLDRAADRTTQSKKKRGPHKRGRRRQVHPRRND